MKMNRAVEILEHRAQCDLCLEDDAEKCKECNKEAVLYSDAKEAYALVAIAAHKAVPYKPKRYGENGYKCVCGTIRFDKLSAYCDKCGQRMDWRE